MPDITYLGSLMSNHPIDATTCFCGELVSALHTECYISANDQVWGRTDEPNASRPRPNWVWSKNGVVVKCRLASDAEAIAGMAEDIEAGMREVELELAEQEDDLFRRLLPDSGSPCRFCDGAGWNEGTPATTCSTCGGSGLANDTGEGQ